MKTRTTTQTTQTPPISPITPITARPATYPPLRLSDAVAQHLLVELCPPGQLALFEATMNERHYLGSPRQVGDYLRQIVRTTKGDTVALLEWGPAAYSLKDRDRHIGWSATQRASRLKLIAQNRRFLLLADKGIAPNLASKALAAALRALPAQWQQTHGHAPLLAETFTDPQRYEGTCYKAANWQPVCTTAGYSRHRADFYIPNETPKHLWLYPLRPDYKKLLTSPKLPESLAPAQTAPPAGTLPVSRAHMLSLHELFAQARDPRGKNTQFKIRPVLTIIAMALLAGRRDIAAITRFGQTLCQQQRQAIGLPRGAPRYWKAPGYKVYYKLLTGLDNDHFASLLTTWLCQRAGELPEALAMDGKMIRDQIGTLTLTSHEDNAPRAMAIHDQKKGTERCELKAAQTLLETLPTLEGKLITADALHCQRQTAALIVERGGDYLLQIRGNQPSLEAHSQTRTQQAQANPGSPFF
jgi:hypothetical protein